MQCSNVPARTRLAVASLGIALVAGACGSETIRTGAPATSAPTSTVSTVVAEPPAPPARETALSPNASDSPAEPTGATSPATTQPPAQPPSPCGEFGPVPALPDSMPTLMFDTDGDGTTDDAVTAYGATDGWRVRVIENSIVSEVLVETITGWAYLADAVPADQGDQIVLVDNDTDETRTYATNEFGCIEPVSAVPVPAAGDLTIVPADPPEPPVLIGDFAAAPDDDLGCGPLAPVPADALIGSELWLDLDGGGVDDDRVVAYFDGTWKLRGEFSFGAESEIEIPDAGVHGVRVIGLADVDPTYGGDEIIAVVGGGASTVEIGVFSFLEGGCIFRYELDGGGDFGVLTGAAVTHGNGMICEDGAITSWGYQQDDDDTYAVWSASFEPVSLGVLGYMPASDGYAEGVTADQISNDLFDCEGLAL